MSIGTGLNSARIKRHLHLKPNPLTDIVPFLSILETVQVELDTNLILAALILQSIYGDCSTSTSTEKIRNRIHRLQLISTFLIQDLILSNQYFKRKKSEDRILEQYVHLRGTSRAQSIYRFMSLIEKQPTYGVHFYEVKDKSGTPFWLGLSVKGISQFDYNDRRLPLRHFPWKQLENLYFREKKFSIEVRDPKRVVHTLSSINLYENAIEEADTFDDLSSAICDPTTQVSVSRRTFGPCNVTVYVWFAASSELTKCIWSMAISQHQFYIDRRLNKGHLICSRTQDDIVQSLENNYQRSIVPNRSSSSHHRSSTFSHSQHLNRRFSSLGSISSNSTSSRRSSPRSFRSLSRSGSNSSDSSSIDSFSTLSLNWSNDLDSSSLASSSFCKRPGVGTNSLGRNRPLSTPPANSLKNFVVTGRGNSNNNNINTGHVSQLSIDSSSSSIATTTPVQTPSMVSRFCSPSNLNESNQPPIHHQRSRSVGVGSKYSLDRRVSKAISAAAAAQQQQKSTQAEERSQQPKAKSQLSIPTTEESIQSKQLLFSSPYVNKYDTNVHRSINDGSNLYSVPNCRTSIALNSFDDSFLSKPSIETAGTNIAFQTRMKTIEPYNYGIMDSNKHLTSKYEPKVENHVYATIGSIRNGDDDIESSVDDPQSSSSFMGEKRLPIGPLRHQSSTIDQFNLHRSNSFGSGQHCRRPYANPSPSKQYSNYANYEPPLSSIQTSSTRTLCPSPLMNHSYSLYQNMESIRSKMEHNNNNSNRTNHQMNIQQPKKPVKSWVETDLDSPKSIVRNINTKPLPPIPNHQFQTQKNRSINPYGSYQLPSRQVQSAIVERESNVDDQIDEVDSYQPSTINSNNNNNSMKHLYNPLIMSNCISPNGQSSSSVRSSMVISPTPSNHSSASSMTATSFMFNTIQQQSQQPSIQSPPISATPIILQQQQQQQPPPPPPPPSTSIPIASSMGNMVEVNVVTVGHFQPGYEEEKPYELADFYKYSQKYRQMASKQMANNEQQQQQSNDKQSTSIDNRLASINLNGNNLHSKHSYHHNRSQSIINSTIGPIGSTTNTNLVPQFTTEPIVTNSQISSANINNPSSHNSNSDGNNNNLPVY
ncbi:FERM domain-containing protein 4A [Blomia tropicalis]|nr:FERM domain-containing protein 4A [Blomia tropicalis]